MFNQSHSSILYQLNTNRLIDKQRIHPLNTIFVIMEKYLQKI